MISGKHEHIIFRSINTPTYHKNPALGVQFSKWNNGVSRIQRITWILGTVCFNAEDSGELLKNERIRERPRCSEIYVCACKKKTWNLCNQQNLQEREEVCYTHYESHNLASFAKNKNRKKRKKWELRTFEKDHLPKHMVAE